MNTTELKSATGNRLLRIVGSGLDNINSSDSCGGSTRGFGGVGDALDGFGDGKFGGFGE